MPFLSPDFWRDLVSLAYLSIAAIIILLVVVGLARAKPKDKRTWLLVPLVAAVVFAPGGWLKYKKWQADQEWAQKQAAQIAHFEMRCKSAGEKIYQTVKGVEGIFIMKPRIVPDESHYQDQFGLWDPYGTDRGEAGSPEILLFPNAKYAKLPGGVEIKGFNLVETVNAQPKENPAKYKRLLRTGEINPEDSLDWLLKKNVSKTFDDKLDSSYGITWDDISTKDDREKWIAGGRLQIVELSTQKVIAERIGYMREPGMGHKQYDRLTWLFAERHACPVFVAEVVKDRDLLARVFPK